MPSRATHVEARLAELPVGHPRQRENFHRRQGLLPTDMVFSPVIARGCTSSLGSWTQWFSLPFPINSAGMTRGSDVRSSSPTSRRASLSSPLGTRVSGEIFTARRCFKPRKWHFRTCHPPATARRCTLSPCSSPWRFSLPPSRSHRVGMEGRHSVDQPHVEVRPAELRSARLRSAELRVPQLRRPKLQRQLSRGGITSVFSMATKPHDAQLRRTP